MLPVKSNFSSRTTVHVDLDAVAHNIRALKQRCRPGTGLMAVVKANAYGHGAVNVSRTALENGACFLAVARFFEAVTLREAGITSPILIFGDMMPADIPWLAHQDVRISLSCLETAKAVSRAALDNNLVVKAHIKVDTGMGRLGFMSEPKKILTDMIRIMALDGLYVEGVYTHLANADAKDKTHAMEQIKSFNILLDLLSSRNAKPKICHAANSAALIELPKTHYNMVRAGISLYGLWPSNEVDHTVINLKPAMSIRSKIIHLKLVPENFKVSYGSTYETLHPTKIATVPIGYADGYSRQLSSKGHMLVQGIKAPVAGRVCMDFTMIDVGYIPGAAMGDDVVIMGEQGNEKITSDDIAVQAGTINYEVVAALTGRMPIEYSYGNKKKS
ncbi:MAG: alanine racemase [Proteobacteria bacterium]|nr:alanine racemase [Pseudomonadota bacterium]MBU1584614.1 alanine racemase [Pseudomonadota bacterium]MBU2453097.1 alanine racemase [Pseudomonadota bacterium]MBU2626995.1 alanine racemase [Pseudomonadota bacterium]